MEKLGLSCLGLVMQSYKINKKQLDFCAFLSSVRLSFILTVPGTLSMTVSAETFVKIILTPSIVKVKKGKEDLRLRAIFEQQ